MQAIRKTPSLPNYLNENQVSERLGVSVKLLRKHRWESKGLCPMSSLAQGSFMQNLRSLNTCRNTGLKQGKTFSNQVSLLREKLIRNKGV